MLLRRMMLGTHSSRRALGRLWKTTLRSFLASSHDTSQSVVMGCVCYDPAVGDIWSGIQEYLVKDCGIPFHYVLYDSYGQQVQSLASNQINVAWNGPVAHVMTEQLVTNEKGKEVVSLGMRDVDRDFESLVVVRKDADITKLQDLHQRTLLLGTHDSPQASIVPYYYLTEVCEVEFGQVKHHDVDIGKHGDTAVGEIQAMEALMSGKGEVAVVSRMMWDRALQGKLTPTIDPAQIQEICTELKAVSIPKFDHCQFDAILTPEDAKTPKKDLLNDFGQALLEMDMKNPKHERLMKLEGIQKEWKLPRQEGYDIVRKATLGTVSAALRHRTATNFSFSPRQKRSFSSSTKPQRIAVVGGGGISGLQTIRALKARGFDVTAFEASHAVGGLWKSNYDSAGVQVPKQLFEFQDFPMTTVQTGEYASRAQVQDYMEDYAKAYSLKDHIRFNTEVTAVSQPEDSKNWKVQIRSTKDGDSSTTTEEFDYLVVSTGLYSNRNRFIPNLKGQESFPGDIVHSCDFTNAGIAKDKRVVVLGGGKSAVDCAVTAAKAGASSVTLLQRTPHWPTPRKIAGIIPFQYIFLSRLGTALVSLHRGTYPGSGRVVNMFRNSIIAPLLMKPVFGLVEELFAFQFGLRGDLRPKEDVVTDFYDVAFVLNSDLKDMRKQGKVDVKVGEIKSIDGSSLSLKAGQQLSADLIVAATGFSQDYSFFSDPAKTLDLQKDGMYLYRGILSDKTPNLAFVGHLAAISNISSYGLQAEWLARYLAGDLVDVPTAETMRNEIEARKAWARAWIPENSMRGMTVLLHQTHYHDQLLRDMGLNPQRKSNPLAEYLMPYEPADYNGIMGGA